VNGVRIIEIRGLQVHALVGVPDIERTNLQRLLVDLRCSACSQPPDLDDNIALTVDYHALANRIVEIVSERPRKLIETLADELTSTVLSEFRLQWIEITVRKFVLPDAQWVAVSVRRERGT